MSPKRNREKRRRADHARRVNRPKSKSQKPFHWTPADWLQLIEAVEQFDDLKSTNWEVVAETLPPETFASVACAAKSAEVHFKTFLWQLKFPEKGPRYTRGVTEKVVQKMKDYQRSGKAIYKSQQNPTRKRYLSRRRGKVERMDDTDSSKTFSTTSDNGQEMSVDKQEGFPVDAEKNSRMVAARSVRGLDSLEDSQSFRTAPLSFFSEDPSGFESFFEEYESVANEILCPMNIQNWIQNGKNRIREKMTQDLGLHRCKALLEPSSWAKSQASRQSLFLRYQRGIICGIALENENLIDRITKGLLINKLLKEE